MSTLTDKLPTVKLPEVNLDEAKKPAFAAVGVVDLYVEQVKELPADAKKLQAELTAKFEAARDARSARLRAVPAQLKALPATTTESAKKLQADLTARVSKAQTEATAYYSKLAARGERLVGQIRRQPATEAAIAEGKAAVKKAEAAATSAKKATKSAVTATDEAAEKLG